MRKKINFSLKRLKFPMVKFMLFNNKKHPFTITLALTTSKSSGFHFTYRKFVKKVSFVQNTIIKTDQLFFNKKTSEIGIRNILTLQQQYFASHPEFTTQYFKTMMEDKRIYLTKGKEEKKPFDAFQKEFVYWQKKMEQQERKLEQIQKIVHELNNQKVIKISPPSLPKEDGVLQKGQVLMRKHLRYEMYRKGNAK